PLERLLRRVWRLWQVDQHAMARRLHIGRVHLACQGGRPQPSQRATACIEREVLAAALVKPAWAHHPRVVATFQIAFLRPGNRGLVPGVAPIDRIAEWVLGNEHLLPIPILVVGGTEQYPYPEID